MEFYKNLKQKLAEDLDPEETDNVEFLKNEVAELKEHMWVLPRWQLAKPPAPWILDLYDIDWNDFF